MKITKHEKRQIELEKSKMELKNISRSVTIYIFALFLFLSLLLGVAISTRHNHFDLNLFLVGLLTGCWVCALFLFSFDKSIKLVLLRLFAGTLYALITVFLFHLNLVHAIILSSICLILSVFAYRTIQFFGYLVNSA